jgi:UDP-galactopyranose mutase
MNYDYLIVGAGLYGVTCARLLTNQGYSCLVIDKNQHIGGSCYTYKYNGIDIHAYGIHIFHTSNKEVWNFVNKYSEFIPMELKVCATDGISTYSLPFNMYTFSNILGLNTPEEVNNYLSKWNNDNPKNFEEYAISNVGKKVFEKLIKGYTEK